MSTNLDPSDVQTVLDVLDETGFPPPNWRALGRRLGVSKVDLDTIEADLERRGVERCLEAVVDNWKRNGENTWEILAEAVSRCGGSGGGSNVARKVRGKVGLQQEVAPLHSLPHQESGDSAIGSEGRPSVSSPISPLPSLSPLELSCEGLLSGEEVKRIAKELTEMFYNIVGETENALKDSNAKPKDVVNIIHRHDAHFSYVAPREFFRELRKAQDMTDLFFELGEYWDPLNYFLLERLLLRPTTKNLFASHLMHVYDHLRECMVNYTKDMEFFRKHTDVNVYCSCVLKAKRPQQVPPGFRELVKKKDFKTLEDVERFRQELAADHKLVDFLVFLKKIETGSVILTFWIPKSPTFSGSVELETSEFGGGDSEGSSVDPFIIREGVKVEWSPLSDEPPVTQELPQAEEPTQQELSQQPRQGGDTKAVVKKRSVAGSVISTVSKLVVPKYVLDPIVLMLAVSNSDKDEVKLLLSKGADPNASPPMVDFTPLMEASRQGNVEIARLLLDKGADPNRTNNECWTALMAAANNDRYGTVDVLLEKGANPDMQDHGGWSALMAAVFKRHDEVALRIIKAEATPHLQDKNHTNAILLAIATNEQEAVVNALLERVEDPSQVDLQDSYGETALIFACKNRNFKLVKRLISMKANPNLCNNHEETPVLIATKRGNKEIVQELLNNHADPNMGNVAPMMIAINLGHKEIADLLSDHGADLYREHEGGVLAFEMAELRNLTDLARRLNPQQFTSRTPRDVLRLTIKSLVTVQKHLSLGPLMFQTDTKKGLPLGRFLKHMLERILVQ